MQKAYGDNLGNWAVTRHRSITVAKGAGLTRALTVNWPGFFFFFNK